MIFVRSLLFNIFFFFSTFVLTFPATALRLFSPARLLAFGRFWASTQIAAARVICGIRLEVTGRENLPSGPVLIAARHESAFDILAWIVLSPSPCFVVKRELIKIPLFGQLIVSLGMIVVDREAGGAAIRVLLREADRAVAQGHQIIIFPEGTRCDPGEFPPLQPGIAALASRTGLPIVPVTTNAGQCWGRRAFAKRPGTIRIAIHPPMDGKQPRAEIVAALSALFRG